MDLLLDAGIDPNLRTSTYQTGLHLAAEKRHHAVVEALQNRGGNANLKDKSGQTALYLAARNNSCDELSQLLVGGRADPDLQDHDGYTPLHVAAVHGHVEAIAVLLAGGADANIRNKRGVTPLLLACSENQTVIPQVLVDNSDVDLNSCDKAGSSALIIASKKGYIDLVLILLEIGVDPNIQDNDHQTALCWASRQGHKYLIEVLMDAPH